MGQVSITVNDRTYKMQCDEGQEAHLQSLADGFVVRVQELKTRVGQVGDDRLLLMAGIMVADELWEAKKKVEELRSAMSDVRQEQSAADERVYAAQSDIAGSIEQAAARIETLAAQLDGA